MLKKLLSFRNLNHKQSPRCLSNATLLGEGEEAPNCPAVLITLGLSPDPPKQ